MPRRLFDDDDERQASLRTIADDLNRQLGEQADNYPIVIVTPEMVENALRKVEGE